MVQRRGTVRDNKVHQRTGSFVAIRGSTEHRKYLARLQGDLQPLQQILLVERPIFKKLVHHFLIGLGDLLDQFLVQRFRLFLQLGRDRLLGVFSAPVTAVPVHLHGQHVGDRFKAKPFLHRKLDDCHVVAEPVLRRSDRVIEVGILIVQFVHEQHSRCLVLFGVAPDDLCPNLRSLDGFQEHDSKIGDAE